MLTHYISHFKCYDSNWKLIKEANATHQATVNDKFDPEDFMKSMVQFIHEQEIKLGTPAAHVIITGLFKM